MAMKLDETKKIARRIAKKLNKLVRLGLKGNGKVVFGPDGSGGEWYSNSSCGFSEGDIVMDVPLELVTVAEVEAYLRWKDGGPSWRRSYPRHPEKEEHKEKE